MVLRAPTADSPKLQEYLATYLRQYNDMAATFVWMQPRLNRDQERAWQRTLEALGVVCRALDAGFDPIAPPRNWASGVLHQYIAPIPAHVREAIDRAEQVFSLRNILIYDPNTEHFSRPRVVDPMAVGFVDLAEQRTHFLIGQWDLAADLKFIDESQRIKRVGQDVAELLDKVAERYAPGITAPRPAPPVLPAVTSTPVRERWQHLAQPRTMRSGGVATQWMAKLLPIKEAADRYRAVYQ